MAYYQGSASDLEALRQAIFTACTGEGWSKTGDVLHHNGIYVRLQVLSAGLRLLGGTGIDGAGALIDPATNYTQIGGLGISYPLAYELFIFANEVYAVVNYSLDRYQWCAWGKSSLASIGGTGVWFGATQSSSQRASIAIQVSGGSTADPCAALFWYSGAGTGTQCCHIHHGLDSLGWASGNSLLGSNHVLTELLSVLPNIWNSEAVLLPARLFILRPSNKYSLLVEAENSRHTRIDHYEPGQVIAIGTERWKVFPWFRKDLANRNGGIGVLHSGTIGWAIRYEGP